MDTKAKVAMDLNYIKDLPQQGKIVAEYIWIDGSLTLRAKCRTLDQKVTSLDQIPEWNFDGSSCYLAETKNSEIIMKPVAYYPDAFRGGDNIMVLCETFMWKDNTYQELIPTATNFRHYARPIFEACPEEEPWFGIEQEYTMLQNQNTFECRPYGWPSTGYPGNQGPYYCSVGGNVCYGRAIADMHYKVCLYAGVTISGTNAEVMPGQWEYQVGPCLGIDQGDHLWMARYLLARVAEEYGITISLEPKIFTDFNGSGCHTNFSTKTMRNGEQGMDYINDMMERFAAKHKLHISLYGEDNEKRLTGHHETSSCETFSFGCGNRAASFRIPTSVMHSNGKGYIEDRRPASNIDPYVVSAAIFDTGVLTEEQSGMEGLAKQWLDWVASVPSLNIQTV